MIVQGDCLERLRELEDESVDAVITDPPYGISFMGHEWDQPGVQMPAQREGVPSGERRKSQPAPSGFDLESDAAVAGRYDHSRSAMHAFQWWCEQWARECLRVLKPGGHIVVAGSPRTHHRVGCAIEDAGFEIRDCIVHLFGQGFPKSLNVSKALTKLPACACEVPGEVGTVDAVAPAGAVRAGTRAEAGTVRLTGPTADAAGGEGSALPGAPQSGSDMEGGVEQVGGEDAPVVLGPGAVAGGAAGSEIRPDIGGVEVVPEALRDQMVDDGGRVVTEGASGGGPEDGGADHGPPDALVLPLASSPSGVVGASEPKPVGDGHALSGAIDRAALPVADGSTSALGADEGPHSLKCERCGGVRKVPGGLGTALKPAAEYWTVGRKPITEKTVAANVLEHGTGAVNVDACRLDTAPDPASWHAHRTPSDGGGRLGQKRKNIEAMNAGLIDPPSGRWPANVVLTHAEDCRLVGSRPVRSNGHFPRERGASGYGSAIPDSNGGGLKGQSDLEERRLDGEVVDEWECVEGCPVRALDEQAGVLRSGTGAVKKESAAGWQSGSMAGRESRPYGTPNIEYGDEGGASRFYFCGKASQLERNAGLDGENGHSTVKPIDLMRWLVRLFVAPGGVVVDPFVGSGTTGCACALEGVQFVGIEREPEYVRIAEARVRYWASMPVGMETERILRAELARPERSGQLSMM